MMNVEDIKNNFNTIERDLIEIKQHFNDMIECILYDNVYSDLTAKDITRIINYRIGIKKCLMMIDLINEGDINGK